MWYQDNNQKGFTLIEALIAIFIFSVALVSLITITARGVLGVSQARDQLTAQFLAQEGVELFRNYRDTLIINENTADLSSSMLCGGQSNACSIKYTPSGSPRYYTLVSNGGSSLSADNTGLIYENNPNGRFRREIWFENTASADKIEVHSEVSWYNGSIPRSVHLVTLLTNWGRF